MARKKKQKAVDVTVEETEVVEVEVVEENEAEPEVEEVAVEVVSETSFESWWKTKGASAIRREKSPNATVNLAKAGYGDDFNQEKYSNFRDENKCVSLKEKVEAVWLSQ